MVIDFHTHIFPERIAERTIATLSKMGGISPYSDGTADGLVSSMERSGVDISVVLPVLTSPSQFDSVIRFAEEINAEYSEKKEKNPFICRNTSEMRGHRRKDGENKIFRISRCQDTPGLPRNLR